MKYRLELDGLRALAVLAVIFYHAGLSIKGIPLFQGGLYGVDVFFVLSGFLITGIIKNDLDNKRFSFLNFYWRRAKRIVPALFFMLLFSAIAAYFLLLSEPLERFAQSLQSTLLFFSNHYFLNEDSYTAPLSVYKPLLHTWSLSVEWQFYVIFPFIYIFLHKYFHRYLFFCLFVLTLISFQLAVILTNVRPDASFYLLATRAWEMLFGGLLVFISRDQLLIKTSNLLRQAIPVFGLFLIGYSLLFLDHHTPHPSWKTLFPVIGTGLFILFANDDLITSILSKKIPVFIGVISYSLYLWHQPIFAYYRIVKNKVPLLPEKILILLTISILAAWLSYRFFEAPFRKNNGLVKRKLLVLFVLFSLLGSYSYLILKYPLQLRPLAFGALNNIGHDHSFNINGKSCFNQSLATACKIDLEKEKRIILLGDSHSGRLGEVVYNYTKDNQLGFIEFSNSGCRIVSGFYPADKTGQPGWKDWLRKQCIERGPDFVDFIEHSKPSILIYMIRMDPHYMKDVDKGYSYESLVKTLEHWGSLGHKVVLVYGTPFAEQHIPNKVKEKIGYNVLKQQQRFEHLDLSTSLNKHLQRSKFSYSLFDKIKDSNIFRAYSTDVFCSANTGRCQTHDKKHIFYTDTNHLSKTGVNMLFEQSIQPILDDLVNKD